MTSDNHDHREDVEKAIAILEEETKKRIDDVQQRVEFMCASLRAQGNMQISKMLTAIRKLTMEEFCESYSADPQRFLDQQKQQRLRNTNDKSNNKKRRLDSFGKSSTDLKRRKSGHSTETEPSTPVKETPIKKLSEPVFIHVNKANQSQVKIQIDPEQQEEKFQITIPPTILSQLNDTQRTHVRAQVQQIIDQLDCLKKSI